MAKTPQKAAPAKGPAKGAAPAPQAAPGQPRKKKSAMSTLFVWVVLLPFIVFTLPTWIFLFFAMLPTVVAFLVERGRYRYAWLCVGGLNFAGAGFFLLKLWFSKGEQWLTMVQLLTNLVNILVIYGTAAFGWALYLSMPPVVGTFLQLTAQRRVQQLQADQKRLVEEWGRDVTADAPPRQKMQ